MKDKVCRIYNNIAPFRLRKQTTDYFQCESCRTLFSDPLSQDGLVGGCHEEGRALQNRIRLHRIETMMHGMKKEDIRILDFGCGHGLLVKYLKEQGYNVTGYDPYNEEYIQLPQKDNFHLCLMVEVVEHTSAPFVELDVINRSLVNGEIGRA